MIKLILKYIGKVLAISSGIAVIGSAYLYVDSIKNKPLTKVEVQEIVKTEIEPVTTQMYDLNNSFSTHVEQNKIQQKDFSTLEQSHLNTLKMVNRLDDVIKYYEQKAENEKKNNELTPYGMNNLIIPK